MATGTLLKAWEEWQKNQVHKPMTAGPGQPVTYRGAVLAPHQVQAMTVLEQELESSLWALATLHTSVFTRADLYKHVGPGHMEDDWYVKRLNGLEVHLLCKCKMILVMQRCMYEFDSPAEFGLWCEEPAFPVEATLRKDTRCGQHHGL